MISPPQFLKHVIRPVLVSLNMGGRAAENLLLGTAITESGLTYLVQHDGGPARGVYQIEPATHDDLWNNWLAYRRDQRRVVHRLMGLTDPVEQLVTNLAYATAIARLVYYRRPEPLPDADDLDGLARYWKAHFNTAAGKGRPEQFVTKAGKHLDIRQLEGATA